MKNRITLLGVLGTVLLSAACADIGKPTAPAAAPPSSSAAAVSSDDQEKAVLNELTRAVALALNDPGLRQRIKNDLRNSRHTHEHKLPFSDYLRGESGGILLAKMAKETGKSREELLALLTGTRPFEFYMPVREHREGWKGEADLLVLGALTDVDASLIAFNLQGEPIVLSYSAPPSTPTLVLVPVETDFSKPLDPQKYRNTNDKNGDAIGTFAMVSMSCEPDTDWCGDDGGGSGSGGPSPDGIYFTEMVIYDKHEPWPRGDPEIEVHLFGQKRGVVRSTRLVSGQMVTQFYPNEYETVQADCAGEEASPSIRKFDFNGENGAHYYRNTLFAEQALFTITEFVQTTANPIPYRREVPLEPPFRIQILERDDGRQCPVAPRKYKFDVTFELNLMPGSWTNLVTVKGFSGEDVMYLLGGNNDKVATWWVGSYAALEQMSNQWLMANTAIEGNDADLRVTNRGFTSATLPPYVPFNF